MGWLSSVGSALSSGGLNIIGDVSGGWSTNSSKESLNKNVTKTNLKYQKQYDLWTQQQDKSYEKWYQNFIYDLQNEEYYNLAKKYATNSAKWAVQGLKDAGLNPILAAIDGNLSSSMGNAQPASSSGTHSGKSIHGASVSSGGKGAGNLTALSQISQSAKQVENMEKQMDINKEQSAADLQVKSAQAENLKADADSKALGNSDWGRNLASVGMVLDSVGLKKPLKELGSHAADWMIRQMGTKQEPSTGKQEAVQSKRIDSVSDSPSRGNILPAMTADEQKALQRSIERSGKRNYKRYSDHIKTNNGILHLR